jgi:TldD protein
MKDPLSIAEEVLLAPAELQHTQLASLMNTLTSSHIDYADLYFQNTFFETWSLEDSQIKGGSYNIDKGVGVRAVSGEKTGFAYSDDIVWTSLLEACHAAKSISNLNKVVKTSKWETKKTPSVYPSVNPLNSMANKDKLALLTQIDEYARAEDPRVQQVNASLSGCYEVILVLNNEGRMVADIRPLVSVHVSVIVEENGKRESARSGGGDAWAL